MKFLNLRKKFITKFIIDGKKYNSFYILNNIFQFLNIKNKHNYQIFNIFFLIDFFFQFICNNTTYNKFNTKNKTNLEYKHS